MKFKNTIKKAKKFPSNSRTIPERLKFILPKVNGVKLLKFYSGALRIFVVFIFIATIVIVGLDLQKNLQTRQVVDFQREVLIKDLNYWENFISKYQNYRDAYFQASILEYRLGNALKAKIYVEKGLSLDPNSRDGKKLAEFLSQ